MNPQPAPDGSTAEHWQQVERLFHELAEIDPLQQRATLEQLAGHDRVLLEEVWSLIRAADASASFLEERTDISEADLDDLLRQLNSDGLSAPDSAATKTGLPPLASGPSRDGSTARLPSGPPVADYRISGPELPDLVAIRQHLEAWRPDYELREVAGRGGAGIVLRAFDRRLMRTVAIKVLLGPSIKRPSSRILQEARAAAIKHDCLVRVYEVTPDDAPLPCLVMEWIEGPSLREWLHRKGALAQRDAARLLRQVAEGVESLHQRGMVHGDIKPANILLEPARQLPLNAGDYRAKVTDFGLARASSEEDDPAAIRFEGTPAFASPERLLENRPATIASDVWSLGATLFQALTGATPYSGATHQIIRSMQNPEPLHPRARDASISRDLDSICVKALAGNPGQRYTTAGELASDLKRFLDGQPVIARPVPATDRLIRLVRRNQLVSALTAATLGMLVALTGLSWFHARRMEARNEELQRAAHETRLAQLQQMIAGPPEGLLNSPEAESLRDPAALEILQSLATPREHGHPQSRINAAVILALAGKPQAESLAAAVADSIPSPAQCEILVHGLETSPDSSAAALRKRLEQRPGPAAHVRLAIAAAAIGDWEPLRELCQPATDPTLRTTLVHSFDQFHPSADRIGNMLHEAADDDLLAALCAALSRLDPRSFSDRERQSLTDRLNVLQSTTQHAGVFSAARLAVQKWDQTPLPRTASTATGDQIREVRPDIRLVAIRPGKARQGQLEPDVQFDNNLPHTVEITQGFWLSTTEITNRQFRAFLEHPDGPAWARPGDWQELIPNKAISPENDHPVQNVTWLEAAAFCNWLSGENGLTPRYRFSPVPQQEASSAASGETRQADNSEMPEPEQVVEIDRQATGFRLPTEAQWEFACRAGTETDYHFGNDFQLLPAYGAFSSARLRVASPCHRLIPNRWGVSGMHGNVWEWCEDRWSELGADPLVDPHGPEGNGEQDSERVFRGGGVATMSGEPGSAARGRGNPAWRFYNVGFRIALPK